MFIPVHNFSNHSIRLPSDTEFGTLEQFSKSLTSKPVHNATCAKVLVDGPGYHEKDNNDRFAKLLSMFDLSKCDCSTEQLGDLKVLLSEHSDVFELDHSELGHSTLVQHAIDTGDNAPIKQQSYRTPIVQCDRITQLIKEMQQQGIVKLSSSPWASLSSLFLKGMDQHTFV